MPKGWGRTTITTTETTMAQLPTIMREALFTVQINYGGTPSEECVKACYFNTEDRMVVFKGLYHQQVFAVNIDCFVSVAVAEIPAISLERTEVSEADEAKWRQTYNKAVDPSVPHLRHQVATDVPVTKSGGADVLFG